MAGAGEAIRQKGGIGKKKEQPKKDASKLLATAKAQEEERREEEEEEAGGDVIVTDRREAAKRNKDKADARLVNLVNSSLTSQQDAPPEETNKTQSLEDLALGSNAAGENSPPGAGSNSAGSLFVGTDSAGSSGQPGHFFGSSSDSSAGPPAGPPVINLVDEEGAPQPTDERDPDDAGLFTIEDFKIATGRDDDGEVSAWRQQGYSKPIIIQYGPPNARRYECSTSARSGLAINEKTTPKFGPDHRLGDVKGNDKKFMRRMHEFKGILGEAFDGPIEGIKPKEHGEKNRKFPRTDVYVKWEIDGEVSRVWEVRASIKHLWPNPRQCDEYIYITAVHHAEQHQQWLDGERQAREKSPTPSPAMTKFLSGGSTPSPRSKNLRPGDSGGKPIKTEEGGGSGASSTETATSEKMSMEDWKKDYFEKMLLDPKEITEEEKHEMREAWKKYKSA